MPAGGLPELVRAVAAARDMLQCPIQALRADRVLGRNHVLMAHHHAQRALEAGRGRADDPAVVFLLYVAVERRIDRALAELGAPRHDRGHALPPLLVVALAPARETEWLAALQDAGLNVERHGDAVWDDDELNATAGAYWSRRLDAGAEEDVEAALLAAMARRAVSTT